MLLSFKPILLPYFANDKQTIMKMIVLKSDTLFFENDILIVYASEC